MIDVPRLLLFALLAVLLSSFGAIAWALLKIRSLLRVIRASRHIPPEEWLSVRRARHSKNLDAVERIMRMEEGEIEL